MVQNDHLVTKQKHAKQENFHFLEYPIAPSMGVRHPSVLYAYILQSFLKLIVDPIHFHIPKTETCQYEFPNVCYRNSINAVIFHGFMGRLSLYVNTHKFMGFVLE